MPDSIMLLGLFCRVEDFPELVESGERQPAFFTDLFDDADQLAGIVRFFPVDANDIAVHERSFFHVKEP